MKPYNILRVRNALYSLRITSFASLFNSRYCLQNCALCSLQSVNMGNFSINIYFPLIIVVVVVVHYTLKNSLLVAHSGHNVTNQKSLCWETWFYFFCCWLISINTVRGTWMLIIIIIIVTNLNVNNYTLTLLVNKTTERLHLQFLNGNCVCVLDKESY